MKFYVKKICTLFLTLFLVMFLAFTAFRIIPGNSAQIALGLDASDEDVAALMHERGLDKPFLESFVSYVGGLLHGDAGISMHYDKPVMEVIKGRLPVTLLTAFLAIFLIIIMAFPIGILTSAIKHPAGETVFTLFNQSFMAVPSFFMGIIITLIFGLILKFFSPGGYIPYNEDLRGCMKYLFWPALAIALPKTAMLVRLIRTGIQKELTKDYVRTARSKGNNMFRILVLHVMKNAMIPVITFFGMMIAEVLAGSIVVEKVFSLPGLGTLLVSEIGARDYPVVQAIMLYIAFTVIIINFIVDLTYKRFDKRVNV